MNTAAPAAEVAQNPAPLDPDFESLYRDNYAFVWRCARRMCVEEAELEDVIQDVFVIAYRRLDTLEPSIRASTWLFGILRNVIRNRGRRRRRHRRRVDAYAEFVGARERQRQHRESELGERLLAGELLAGFLRVLNEDQRAVFVLAELEGYSGREIAQTLGIKPNTAHSRLRLARRAFCGHFGLEPKRSALESATRALREHKEQPASEAQAHSWGLVLAAVARPGWWASSSASGLLGLLSGKLGLTLGLAGAVALTALVSVGVVATNQAREPRAQVQAPVQAQPKLASSSLAPSTPPIDDAASSPTPEPQPVPIIAAPPNAVELPHGPGRAAKAPASAVEQLRLARAALISGQPEQTLELLDQIPESDSHLYQQRVATRVAASCKLGQPTRARALIEELRAREPDAAIIARIDHACW